MKKIITGEKSRGGRYRCLHCGQVIYASRYEDIPLCPKCTGREFRR